MDAPQYERIGLSCGCFVSLCCIGWIMVTYARDKRLHQRPASLLCYRALSEFCFCLLPLVLEFSFMVDSGLWGKISGCLSEQDRDADDLSVCIDNAYLPDRPIGDDSPVVGFSPCRAEAAWLQFFNLMAESWYFIISIDLVANIYSSPFSSSSTRKLFYFSYCFLISVFTSVYLTRGDAKTASWGPNPDLLPSMCWNKSFGTKGTARGINGGYLFLYLWLILYYSFGLVSFIIAERWLSKGIPKSMEPRERRIKEAKTIVIIFTVYYFTFFGLYYLVLESGVRNWSENTTAAVKIIFSFALGVRGLPDLLVWHMVVLKTLPDVDTALAPVAKHGMSLARKTASVLRLGGSKSTGLSEGILGGADSGGDWINPPEMDELNADSVDLNKALQDEVLFFCLLGLREGFGAQHNPAGAGRFSVAGEKNSAVTNVNLEMLLDELQRNVEASSGSGRRHRYSVGEIDMWRGSLERWSFDFQLHCDQEFTEMRRVCGITTEEYTRSLSDYKNARFDGGASGAIMFFSQDSRYIVKQMTGGELKVLQSIMRDYVGFMSRHPDSLLVRVVQACSIKMYRQTLHFMVIENCFYAGAQGRFDLSLTYDLKGSWVNRNASAMSAGSSARCRLCNEKYVVGSKHQSCVRTVNRKHKPEQTLKDNDLNEKIYLPDDWMELLKRQMDLDSKFLRDHQIMDYSLLLGVNERSFNLTEQDRQLPAAGEAGQYRAPFHVTDEGGVQALLVVGPGTYYMGIIDILQKWDLNKKLERLAKRLLRKDPDGLSAIEPNAYQDRFVRGCAEKIMGDPTELTLRSESVSSPGGAGALSPSSSKGQSPRASPAEMVV